MKIKTLASMKATDEIGDSNFNDSEFIGGVIYAATTYQVLRWHINGSRVQKDNSFGLGLHARALEQWNGKLIIVCDDQLIMFDPTTNKTERAPLKLPEKNLLSKRVKDNIWGKEVVLQEYEGNPHIWKKTKVVDNELYVIMQYSDTTVEDRNGKTLRRHDGYSIVCVYDLPSLALKKHYKLLFPSKPGRAHIFAISKPYMFYNYDSGGAVFRLNMTTGTTERVALHSNSGLVCTSLAADEKHVYAFYGSDRDDGRVAIIGSKDFKLIETIDIAKQVQQLSQSIKEGYEKVLSEKGLRWMKDEDFKQHYGKEYNDNEIGGFIRATNGNGEYFCVMDADSASGFGSIAVATELGVAPGFLWDIKTKKPKGYLFGIGETVVSRKIKVRLPYIISTAFEHLHLWSVVEK